jgi:hypothetical protein
MSKSAVKSRRRLVAGYDSGAAGIRGKALKKAYKKLAQVVFTSQLATRNTQPCRIYTTNPKIRWGI